jgi:hypothetical protein
MADTNPVVEYDKNSQLEVKTLTITKAANGSTPVDITSLYENILIYEDIFQTAISARLIFADQVSLISSFPIVGGEKISIEFRTPCYTSFVKLDFIVYQVGDRDVPNSSENLQMNQLFLCTPEVWWAANNDISAGYAGPYSDIIAAMLKETGTTKTLTNEATTGINNFVAPMWNVFEAIKWCASRSNSQSLSPLFFWESTTGFFFESLKNMYDNAAYKRIYIEDRTPYGADTSSDKVFNAVYSYDFPKSNDKLKQFSKGAFGNDTFVLDITNKQITKNTKSYFNDVFTTQNIHIEGFPISDDAISLRHKTDFVLKKTDSSELSDYTKKATIALMDNVRILVSVPGDSNLRAGMTIWLEIPARVELSIGKDEYVSGKWLVRSIKHNIHKQTYSQVLELTKDSFAKAVRST